MDQTHDSHIVKVLHTAWVTHNVRRFIVEKPAGYDFVPGQATDVSINRPGLEDELRPFTFTALPSSPALEFTIKIYKGHNGVTEKLGDLAAGDELIVHEVFGSIHYQGPGILIAGGAGITPFICILRQLKESGRLNGMSLLFANRTVEDIILEDELTALLGERYTDILHYPLPGFERKDILQELIAAIAREPGNSSYYVCGPDQFTADMIAALRGAGIDERQIVFEK